ncbi:MAG: acyl carrier protein [Saprospiraceae bacterium]|jgi:acyl carrier protein
MDCFNDLQKLIAKFFSINNEVIDHETTAHDIQDWDSFSHMELMSSIEAHFKLKIPFTEIMEFNCVGDIVTYLDSKNTQ